MTCIIHIFLATLNPVESLVDTSTVLRSFTVAWKLTWHLDYALASFQDTGHLLASHYTQGTVLGGHNQLGKLMMCGYAWSSHGTGRLTLIFRSLSPVFWVFASWVTNKHPATQWWLLSWSQFKSQLPSICARLWAQLWIRSSACSRRA